MCVYLPAGGGLSMGRESMNPMGQSVHNSVTGARAPFTTTQWQELEHQALIFKYMMAGVNVPNELLNPIRKSVATMNGLASHHASNRKSRTMLVRLLTLEVVQI